MSRFFKYELSYPEDKFLQMYWQSRRSGDNLHSVIWLYNHTGESYLLDLAKKLHRKGLSWTPTSNSDWYKTMPDWHNVNIAQGLREGAIFWQVSKQKSDLDSSRQAFDAVRMAIGQVPGGMFGADENARRGYTDPRQAIETCGIVEQMNSDEELFRISGDPFWAEHAENVAFNSYPAATMPDMRSLRYLTAPNMVLSDDQNHAPGIANQGPFLMMNPFSSRCCQHNHGMGWPYFAENLLLGTADNGLAAAIYSSFSATALVGRGVLTKVMLETHYPFEDTLRFTISPSTPVTFPLYLRRPTWSDHVSISLNGKPLPIGGEPSLPFYRIEREWKVGDKVVVKMPMKPTIQTWAENKGSVSVNYGPLTLSLKIEESYAKRESTKTAVGDSKWQDGADPSKWPSYMISPKSDWNYGLLDRTVIRVRRKAWPKSNYPFSLAECPISFEAQGKQIPEWTIDQYGLCGVLPPSPVLTSSPVKVLPLVPMGAARLRISAFPVVR